MEAASFSNFLLLNIYCILFVSAELKFEGKNYWLFSFGATGGKNHWFVWVHATKNEIASAVSEDGLKIEYQRRRESGGGETWFDGSKTFLTKTCGCVATMKDNTLQMICVQKSINGD